MTELLRLSADGGRWGIIVMVPALVPDLRDAPAATNVRQPTRKGWPLVSCR